MRNSDWSSDVCSSDLLAGSAPRRCVTGDAVESSEENPRADQQHRPKGECHLGRQDPGRHTHGDTQEKEAKDILDGSHPDAGAWKQRRTRGAENDEREAHAQPECEKGGRPPGEICRLSDIKKIGKAKG